MSKKFEVVVAMDQDRCIGKDGSLPWHLPGELKHFRALTTKTGDVARKNAVVMGRKTWESIPDNRRPLSGRHNIVLSRTLDTAAGATIARSLEQALQIAAQLDAEHCFVIGGGQIYENAIEHGDCEILYLTQIENRFDCDTHFPDYTKFFDKLEESELIEENGLFYRYCTFKRKGSLSSVVGEN
jgi:dihydrofolate reductase/thymidylate synthase